VPASPQITHRRQCHSIRDKLKDHDRRCGRSARLYRYLSEEATRTGDFSISAIRLAGLLADGSVSEAELSELCPQKVAKIRRFSLI
jgi:hypothetical protein